MLLLSQTARRTALTLVAAGLVVAVPASAIRSPFGPPDPAPPGADPPAAAPRSTPRVVVPTRTPTRTPPSTSTPTSPKPTTARPATKPNTLKPPAARRSRPAVTPGRTTAPATTTTPVPPKVEVTGRPSPPASIVARDAVSTDRALAVGALIVIAALSAMIALTPVGLGRRRAQDQPGLLMLLSRYSAESLAVFASSGILAAVLWLKR